MLVLSLLKNSGTRSELGSVLNGVGPQLNIFDGPSSSLSNAPEPASCSTRACEIPHQSPKSILPLRHFAIASLKCSVRLRNAQPNRAGVGFVGAGLDRAEARVLKYVRPQAAVLARPCMEIDCDVLSGFRSATVSRLKQIGKFLTCIDICFKAMVDACSRISFLGGPSSSSAVTTLTYKLQFSCLNRS
jgi:hypothetical protein